MKRILHISYSNDSSEGGVYFYLKEFLKMEKIAGIDSHWITIKSKNSI